MYQMASTRTKIVILEKTIIVSKSAIYIPVIFFLVKLNANLSRIKFEECN